MFHKNLIKVYLQYYKYCYKDNNNGVYRLSQKETLNAIGLNGNSQSSKCMLRDINALLIELGMIKINDVKNKKGTVYEIRCPNYTESSLYSKVLRLKK